MKRFFSFLVALLCFSLFFSLRVLGAEYIDDIQRLDNSVSKEYYNLTLSQGGNFKDNTFATFSNLAMGRGGVIYRLQGGESVAVSIYSGTGTQVSKNKEGSYVMGDFRIMGGTSTDLSARFSPSTGSAYIFAEGEYQRLVYDTLEGYVFAKSQEAPKDLIPYALSIWSSKDGENYSLLAQSKTGSYHYANQMRFWEEWTAFIPRGATYLKIEINDTSAIDSKDGTMTYSKSPMVVTDLAQVMIKGESLTIGIPEAVISEPELTSQPVVPTSSVEESTKGSGKTTSKQKGKSTTSEKEEKPTDSKEKSYSSSKFEGSIAEEAKGTAKKSGSSGKVSSKETSKALEDSGEKELDDTEKDETEQKVYMVEGPEPQKDGFTVGVIFYIVAVSAFILFLLLRPKS